MPCLLSSSSPSSPSAPPTLPHAPSLRPFHAPQTTSLFRLSFLFIPLEHVCSLPTQVRPRRRSHSDILKTPPALYHCPPCQDSAERQGYRHCMCCHIAVATRLAHSACSACPVVETRTSSRFHNFSRASGKIFLTGTYRRKTSSSRLQRLQEGDELGHTLKL